MCSIFTVLIEYLTFQVKLEGLSKYTMTAVEHLQLRFIPGTGTQLEPTLIGHE